MTRDAGGQVRAVRDVRAVHNVRGRAVAAGLPGGALRLRQRPLRRLRVRGGHAGRRLRPLRRVRPRSDLRWRRNSHTERWASPGSLQSDEVAALCSVCASCRRASIVSLTLGGSGLPARLFWLFTAARSTKSSNISVGPNLHENTKRGIPPTYSHGRSSGCAAPCRAEAGAPQGARDWRGGLCAEQAIDLLRDFYAAGNPKGARLLPGHLPGPHKLLCMGVEAATPALLILIIQLSQVHRC